MSARVMPARDLDAHWELLRDGFRRFHSTVFGENREMYERAAASPQQPHTLFITCADSRVDPEALVQSRPGELFVTRNIGNMAPAYGEMLGGVSAVIEYAVLALDVSQIVVCGHTDCGAMKGLLDRPSVSRMPTVDRWLHNGEAALSVARARNPDLNDEAILTKLVEENVLLQLAHLRTHPSVAGALAQGRIALHGWVYDIRTGQVCEHDGVRNTFLPIL
jgi:carbonic anhydrase